MIMKKKSVLEIIYILFGVFIFVGIFIAIKQLFFSFPGEIDFMLSKKKEKRKIL